MFSQILAAIGTIRQIIDGINALIKFVEDSRNESWWQDWQQTMIQLRNAKTSEDRKNAAGKIADSLSKL